MLLEKTRGIVLHRIKYSDTSSILKIYTRDFGLLSFMVKGLNVKKGRFRPALFQPLTILNMECSIKENRGLQSLREVSVHYPLEKCNMDIQRVSVMLFMAELLGKCIREEETNAGLFDYVEEQLVALENFSSYPPLYHLKFMLGLTGHLGFYPWDNYSEADRYFSLTEGKFENTGVDAFHLDIEASARVHELLQDPAHLPLATRRSLLHNLIRYFQCHIPGFTEIKSVEVFEEMTR